MSVPWSVSVYSRSESLSDSDCPDGPLVAPSPCSSIFRTTRLPFFLPSLSFRPFPVCSLPFFYTPSSYGLYPCLVGMICAGIPIFLCHIVYDVPCHTLVEGPCCTFVDGPCHTSVDVPCHTVVDVPCHTFVDVLGHTLDTDLEIGSLSY